jgi:hypothetical protein
MTSSYPPITPGIGAFKPAGSRAGGHVIAECVYRGVGKARHCKSGLESGTIRAVPVRMADGRECSR